MVHFLSFLFQPSLRNRLIAWFLAISLIPLIWVSFLSYGLSEKILLNQAIQHLKALSLQKAELIENYFREKEQSAISISKGLTALQALRNYERVLSSFGPHSNEYRETDKKYRPILTFRSDLSGYKNLLLVNTEGLIVFSIDENLIGTNIFAMSSNNTQLKDVFNKSKNRLNTQISNFILSQPTLSSIAFIATPILNELNLLLGILIFQIDNSAIADLTTSYSGLGQTGETLFVTKADDQLLSIGPLRSSNKEAEKNIPLDTPLGQLLTRVLNGERLVEIITDYRGEQTLVVGRYLLPSLSWAILTKMDMAELIEPINKLKTLSLLIALTVAGLVILIASSLAKSIAYPISQLIHKTQLIAAGELSQTIEVNTDDEFGRLANSFNRMATQLNNVIKNLDIIVARRTEEVEYKNIQLEQTIEELKQAQDRLINQEKLASLGALTAGIAHEIKNPLNFINNFAELSLQIETELTEQFQKIKSLTSQEEWVDLEESLSTLKLNVNKIYEHGKRADRIVKNMLEHSRGTPEEKAAIDLNALLDEYVNLSFHGMRAQDISFNVKIEKNYDPTIGKVSVFPQELSRVFLNLLNNAYYSIQKKKKIAKGGYTPLVRITTENQEYVVIIKIWDNGMGITPAVFSKLFVPFFTTKPAGEGTGLGLSLSYNIIVHSHGGTIVAKSEPDQFAEFIIRLPRKIKS